MKKIEYAFVILALLPMSALVYKYFVTDGIKEALENQSMIVGETLDYQFGDCPDDQLRVDLKGGVYASKGYLCRDEAAPSEWLDVYDSYPKSMRGQETLFDFLEEGHVETADSLLDNWIPISRFEPIKVEGSLTWEEDPYQEPYWRFQFYSLRFTSSLLYAAKETEDPKYYDKLIETVESFIDKGMDKPSEQNAAQSPEPIAYDSNGQPLYAEPPGKAQPQAQP